MNPYANLQSSNAGDVFMQSFQRGQGMRRESETQNALSQYALNPQDPKTVEALAKWNPQMAIQIRQQQQQQQQAALEQHRERIVKGAQIMRQMGVKDDASYQAALRVAQQVGIDLSDVPRQYDPQYVQGLVAVADSFAPQKQNEGPSSVQEYEYAKQQGFGGSYMEFMEEKRGPIVANNGDGTFTLIPRGAMGGQPQQGQAPQPGQVEDGYRFKGGNPADPNAWEPANGGPTPQASGGFRP